MKTLQHHRTLNRSRPRRTLIGSSNPAKRMHLRRRRRIRIQWRRLQPPPSWRARFRRVHLSSASSASSLRQLITLRLPRIYWILAWRCEFIVFHCISPNPLACIRRGLLLICGILCKIGDCACEATKHRGRRRRGCNSEKIPRFFDNIRSNIYVWLNSWYSFKTGKICIILVELSLELHEMLNMDNWWSFVLEYLLQSDIFELVGAPLVENCLAGFNSSVFAYGQVYDHVSGTSVSFFLL